MEYLENEVEVRRFAIKYSPPTIVIEYKKNGKLYMKKIKLNINPTSVSLCDGKDSCMN